MEVEKTTLLPAQEKGYLYTQICLRILTVVFALCSICITVSSDQIVVYFGFIMPATYRSSTAFRFYIIADSIVCAIVFCSLIYVAVSNYRTSKPRNHYFYILLHDIVMTILMISGCAAATAVGYIGKYGQIQTGWLQICSGVQHYCQKMTIAVVFAYLCFLSLLCLSFNSAHKIHSLSYSSRQ